MTTVLPFEPDETVVLLNDRGGRLFVVGFVDANSYDEDTGTYRVFEKQERPHNPRFDVSSSRLVKVSSKDRAIALVSRLELLHEQHRSRVYESEQIMKKAQRSAVGDFAENYVEVNVD